MHHSGRTYLLQLILLLNCRTTRFIPFSSTTPLSCNIFISFSRLFPYFFRLQFSLFSFPSFLPSFLLFTFSHSCLHFLSLSLCIFSFFLSSFLPSSSLPFFPSLHPFRFSFLYSPFIYSSCVPSSFIHSFHVLLPLFSSLLFDSNLPFPHYVLFVFTALNDARKWEIHKYS